VTALARRAALRAPAGSHGLRYTPTNTAVYPLVCSFAGLIAGLFGLGGGVVKAPMMLQLGVPPDVAAATSATMILFTGASAAVVYLAFGLLPLDYGAPLFLLGMVFNTAGQRATNKLVRAFGRRSIIVLLMAALMTLSAAAALAHAAAQWQRAAHGDASGWKWGDICTRAAP
jgi:uncharacterized membrane protein YfcA